MFVLVKRNRRENKNKRKKINKTYLMCYHLNNCSLRLMFVRTENFRVFTSPSRSSLQLACLRPLLSLKRFSVNLTYKSQAKLLSQMNFYINKTNKFKKLLKRISIAQSFNKYYFLKKKCQNMVSIVCIVKEKQKRKNKRKIFNTTYLMCYHPNNCSLLLTFG